MTGIHLAQHDRPTPAVHPTREAPAQQPRLENRAARQPHSPPPQRAEIMDRRTTHTKVSVIHDTRVQVVRDSVRVPPPVNVTWQALTPYSQNILGQLFDFYDTDSQ